MVQDCHFFCLTLRNFLILYRGKPHLSQFSLASQLVCNGPRSDRIFRGADGLEVVEEGRGKLAACVDSWSAPEELSSVEGGVADCALHGREIAAAADVDGA